MSAMTCAKKRQLKIEIAKKLGWNCFYCGCELIPVDEMDKHTEKIRIWNENQKRFNDQFIETGIKKIATLDHIIPKSKGGWNFIGNYVLSCYECNAKKKDDIKPVDWFYAKQLKNIYEVKR